MGEQLYDFPDRLFREISYSFDQVLKECNNLINDSKSTTESEAMVSGSKSSTLPCGLCGRKFLPERIVSLIFLFSSSSFLLSCLSLFLESPHEPSLSNVCRRSMSKHAGRFIRTKGSPLTQKYSGSFQTMAQPALF